MNLLYILVYIPALVIALVSYITVCVIYIKNKKLRNKQKSKSKMIKNNKIKLILFVAAGACILASSLIANSFYHTCGDGVKWSLSDDGSTLTITANKSDTGIDDSYTDKYAIRLNENKKAFVTDIVIEDGISFIGTYAFEGFERLARVTLPKTIKNIEAGAFCSCDSIMFLDVYYEGDEEDLSVLQIEKSRNELFLQKFREDYPKFGIDERVLTVGTNNLAFDKETYSFTPSKSGWYKFELISSTDTYDGYFGIKLEHDNGESVSEEYNGDGTDYYFSYYLNENENYIWSWAHFYSGSNPYILVISLDDFFETAD